MKRMREMVRSRAELRVGIGAVCTAVPPFLINFIVEYVSMCVKIVDKVMSSHTLLQSSIHNTSSQSMYSTWKHIVVTGSDPQGIRSRHFDDSTAAEPRLGIIVDGLIDGAISILFGDEVLRVIDQWPGMHVVTWQRGE